VRAVVRSIHLIPDPRDLPADPAEFVLLALMLVGPRDGPGEESFTLTVCTPEALARRCATEGFVDGRHTIVTTVDAFSEPGLRSFLTRRVENLSGQTWPEVAQGVARIGLWEFEDHRP
jgi:hypothetical protein